MSLTRTTAATALVAGLSLVSACGGSSADPDEGVLGSPTATQTTAPGTPTVTPVAPTTPAATTPTQTPKPTPTAGDGGADGGGAPSTRGGGVCSHLGASQVGAIVGRTVKGSAVSGATGCTFADAGARGITVTVLDKSAAEAGGMDGAKAEANSAVEGTPQDLSGIGSAAFLITGSMFGGPDVNAAGAVQVGSRIISVFLEQRSGLAETKVRNMEVSLLKLVAHAAS